MATTKGTLAKDAVGKWSGPWWWWWFESGLLKFQQNGRQKVSHPRTPRNILWPDPPPVECVLLRCCQCN